MSSILLPPQAKSPEINTISPTPIERLFAMLKEDRHDLLVIATYTVAAGLLSLAVPLAAQSVVNIIAAGIFLQPLIVLSVLVFIGLIFAGILRAFQFYIIEMIQRRIFVKVSLRLADRIPRIQEAALDKVYAPELLNRFFDVLTVQKTWAKMLLDGPASILQVLVGMALLSFYSPFLLAFNALLILFMLIIVFVLGWNGLRTNMSESFRKYQVAKWLEELGRCQKNLKLNGDARFFAKKTDELVAGYLDSRQSHFSVIFRQMIGNHFFQALASAGILALGGWLVINRQMTLGQLVASELVVVNVLSAVEKLVRLLEETYDLLTGMDKVGHITDLPVERVGGKIVPAHPEGSSVHCRGVYYAYDEQTPVLKNLNLHLEPGEHIAIVGRSGAGKSTLAALLCGLVEPSHGMIEVDGLDTRDIDLIHLRNLVALVSDSNDIFDGTIEENLLVGRNQLDHQDVRWALEMTQLNDELTRFPKGLKTHLISEGQNLSRGQRIRLLLARAIADRPKLLILDETFGGIEETLRFQILANLFQTNLPWTVIVIAHDEKLIAHLPKVHVLENGQIEEIGDPFELAAQPDSNFSQLFPEFSNQTVRRKRRKAGGSPS